MRTGLCGSTGFNLVMCKNILGKHLHYNEAEFDLKTGPGLTGCLRVGVSQLLSLVAFKQSYIGTSYQVVSEL